MLETKQSPEREFLKKTVLNALKDMSGKYGCQTLYLEARSKLICQSYVSESEIYGAGLFKIYFKDRLPSNMKLDRVVIFIGINQVSLKQIDEFADIIQEAYILSICLTNKENGELLKKSKISNKIKAIKEINIDFSSYLDKVYVLNHNCRQKSYQDLLIGSLSSFLISRERLYEYELIYKDKSENTKIASQIAASIEDNCKILGRHSAKSLNQVSSPKIKILLLDRKEDIISPLLYGYFYGSISNQLSIGKNNKYNSVFSLMYNNLFSDDLIEASVYLDTISKEKESNAKIGSKITNMNTTKKAFTKNNDSHTSAAQIKIHVQSLSSVQEFCRIQYDCSILQQSIANNMNEFGQKMSNSKVIRFINEWIKKSPTIFEYDYLKMVMIAYLTHSFWFFHKSQLNSGIPQVKKEKFQEWLLGIKGKQRSLSEKTVEKDEQLPDIYRHQPVFISQIRDFLNERKMQSKGYQKIFINKSMKKREIKYVIYIHGVLGFNQLAMILNQCKSIKEYGNFSIVCANLVTTNQFADMLLDGIN